MCGIAGIVYADAGRPVEEDRLRAMLGELRLRGPDDEHVHLEPGAGLGARRLAVIDVAGGRQPLSNEDGSVWVAFNGEIYDFPGLRDELRAKGHRFRTSSDTEVLVHLYEECAGAPTAAEAGRRMAGRLRGMFAFGLWDSRRRRLLLARDRMGKKPLYYWAHDGGLAFASSLPALLTLPELPREIDRRAVDAYFALKYVPSPLSILKAARKLPAAHLLAWEGERFSVERHWALDYEPKLRLGYEEAKEELLRLLRAAVRRRLVSDVPIGALLSGGVDSSAVVALMAEAGPVKTFSVGFESGGASELPYARQVARRYGTDHHEDTVTTGLLSLAPEAAVHHGEPFGDSSTLPTHLLARLARREVTVALNGDGGDECFAGYDRHDLPGRFGWADRLPAGLRRSLAAATGRWTASSNGLLRGGARLLAYAAWPPGRRYADYVSYVHSHLRPRLYRPEFIESLGGYDPQAELAALFDAAPWSLLDRGLAADVAGFLPDQLCVKMDVATMSSSLEARSPFLDQDLVEFAARLPAEWRRRRGRGKLILKDALERLLPEDVLRRPKQGFVVPLAEWTRRPQVLGSLREELAGGRCAAAEFLRPEALDAALAEHAAGRRNWAGLAWCAWMFGHWRREVLGG